MGTDGLLDWIPAPAEVIRFFLGQLFFPFPFPGAFVAPVGLSETIDGGLCSAFGASATFGTVLERYIVFLFGDIMLALLEGLIVML